MLLNQTLRVRFGHSLTNHNYADSHNTILIFGQQSFYFCMYPSLENPTTHIAIVLMIWMKRKKRNQRKFHKNYLIVSITFMPSIFTDFLIKIVNTTTCLPLANRKLSNLLKIQRPHWNLSSTIVDKFLEFILEPRDKTPPISKSFRHGTQDAKLVNFVS